MNYDWPQPFDEWREETFHNQEIVAKAGFEANIIENHDQPRGASLFIPEEDYGFYSLSDLQRSFSVREVCLSYIRGKRSG